MPERILLIGTARWEQTLRRHWNVARASSGRAARNFAGESFPVIIIDAASMHTAGIRICRDLRTCFPNATLIHIGTGESIPTAHVSLIAPVSARNLIGVVSRILSDDPLDTVGCGPFSLNRTTRILRAHGRETQLNPKLSLLIDVFLSNPNQTLPRSAIMQQVWNTDYLGDTRTLNVHIRHARILLETDPRCPTYLKTIRGTGYRLEIPTEKTQIRQSLSDSDPANSV